MKLREYLDDNMLMIREFTKQMGVTEHTIYNWLNGTVPLRIHRLLVEKVTEGQVKLKDWETTNESQREIDRRVRSSKVNEVRKPQRVVANTKAKPKSSKKVR